jgi:hypothetical protein
MADSNVKGCIKNYVQGNNITFSVRRRIAKTGGKRSNGTGGKDGFKNSVKTNFLKGGD